ncbi:conjugal transfer protein [Streptococcus sanguinis]|uniref:Conjugal transfer protein n=1 Tax=Streptococcus sanguinis TaxID=1305 RepID=A0A7H8V3D7_STRSA|nr:conjugal transfer protein [Streptococcus sanguinis]QLB50960.1 conjugal transfer protein [Streptococcus sanguinis]
MQEAFEKLKGVDIFSLKSYMEETSWGSTNIFWVMLNEIFVNFPFFLLNLIVGFFSLMIRIFERIDLYGSYKQYVYNGSKAIWQSFTGATSGVAQGSLVFLLLMVLGFYLFFCFVLSSGSFSRKLLHVLAVVALGFAWFGTVSGTSGGLYILDTIDSVADTATEQIANISVPYGDNQNLKIGESMADSYIAETSYKAYLFVNTGQENGKYKNRQTNKEEAFDDSKVLGSLDGVGKFKAVSSKDRKDYLNEIGDGADDDTENNRWVSAIVDYIPVRFFYVLFKTVEAIVIAVPIILIQLLNLIAQSLVLIMILLFPVALLISFVPRMQDILFGVFKIMFGGLAFPAITSLLILSIFYLEKMIEGLLMQGFTGAIKDYSSLSTFDGLFRLMVGVVGKAAVYFLLWKYKGELIELLLGSRSKVIVTQVDDKMRQAAVNGKEKLSKASISAFEGAQKSTAYLLAGAGLGAGIVATSGKQIKDWFSGTRPSESEKPVENSDVSKEEETRTDPLATEASPFSYEGTDYKQAKAADMSFSAESRTIQETEEFEKLRENRLSRSEKRKVEKLEKELESYQEPEAMYQAQGSNAFIRGYHKAMSKDDILKENIRRKNDIINELNKLRGEG